MPPSPGTDLSDPEPVGNRPVSGASRPRVKGGRRISSTDLIDRVSSVLNPHGSAIEAVDAYGQTNGVLPSVVLFLLSPRGDRASGLREPCIVLTKRSQQVKQAGDLCCPGGGIAPRFDSVVGRVLHLPGTPLTRWPNWKGWRAEHPRAAARLAVFLAAGLREAVEEMRLNPVGIRFLGALPPQELIMFRRIILPLVVWIDGQQRFFPNWEVERPVSIPLRRLCSPDAYACYRLTFHQGRDGSPGKETLDFPCFVQRDGKVRDILWGATYRITMEFLKRVFDFEPPSMNRLPVIEGRLSRRYSTGNGRGQGS